jgi:hypothetical protein
MIMHKKCPFKEHKIETGRSRRIGAKVVVKFQRSTALVKKRRTVSIAAVLILFDSDAVVIMPE